MVDLGLVDNNNVDNRYDQNSLCNHFQIISRFPLDKFEIHGSRTIIIIRGWGQRNEE